MGSQRLLEIKPDGTEVWFSHDSIEKKNHVFYKQPDIEPVLEYTKALRLCSEYTKDGIKREFWHYATIPNIIIMKLRTEYGLDFWNQDHRKRIFEVIESDFPYLKVTDKRHRFK